MNRDIERHEKHADQALERGKIEQYEAYLARVDALIHVKSSLLLIAVGRVSGFQSITRVGTALQAYFICLSGKSTPNGEISAEEEDLRKKVMASLIALVEESQSQSKLAIADAESKIREANVRAELAEINKNAEAQSQQYRLRKEERESHGWWWQLFHQ
ncbi:MAG: hypothetical protein LBI69_00135 [Puniceicoccales bacterium]|nr:hypothetical protein [Puniceicoccales bacterium]